MIDPRFDPQFAAGEGGGLFPPAASTAGQTVDWVAAIVFAIITLVVLAVLIMMVTYAARYRISDRRRRGEPHRNVRRIEVAMVTGTTVVFVGFFVLGVYGFDRAQHPPTAAGALDVLVLGKQWMWKFQQPTGRREVGQLHVPVGRVVRLHLSSEDVIHSFYVPAFRLKHDVVPGLDGVAWFEATAPGVYPIYCAEYCGLEHAQMHGEVIVMEPRLYEAWLAEASGVDEPGPMVARGRALYERLGCVACHETHLRHRAPPLQGLYGRRAILQSGEEVPVDDAYLRRSILRPSAQIVAGYDDHVMPAYEGLITDDELFALVAYLRELGRAEGVHR